MEKIRAKDYRLIKEPAVFYRYDPNASVPSKNDMIVPAWDIQIVARTDNRSEDVIGDMNEFRTGFGLGPPKNYHFEIFEHPDLHKAGYTLSGGITVLDPRNIDEIVLTLFKYKSSEDIELPFTAARIILRESEYTGFREDEAPEEEFRTVPIPIKKSLPAPQRRQLSQNHPPPRTATNRGKESRFA